MDGIVQYVRTRGLVALVLENAERALTAAGATLEEIDSADLANSSFDGGSCRTHRRTARASATCRTAASHFFASRLARTARMAFSSRSASCFTASVFSSCFSTPFNRCRA